MSPNQWPWSPEEELLWEEELRRQEYCWMEEMIDHMVNDSLASSTYDPLQPHDVGSEEEVISS